MKTITLEFEDMDWQILEDGILDPTEWIQNVANVKMGKVKKANKVIRSAINYLIKKKCNKIILGCTELPIAIFAFKSFKTIKSSKIFLDPNLILANAAMKKYKK